jgi:hypothetical protein
MSHTITLLNLYSLSTEFGRPVALVQSSKAAPASSYETPLREHETKYGPLVVVSLFYYGDFRGQHISKISF